MKRAAVVLVLTLGLAPATHAQFGSILKRAEQAHDEVKSITISEADEQLIGAGISEKVRKRYGVVQNVAIHKYVTLVGTLLAQSSKRPALPWKFIVLDTDGVNAFAAPGGYIHITRGALALIHDEADLAGVLAHEMTHVTEKHTISALEKKKLAQQGANQSLKGNATLLNAYVDNGFELVYAGFGRAEELEADAKGIVLANQVGYAPDGLEGFLKRVDDRNKSASEKQGLFASHPEMKERIDRLAKEIADDKLAATARATDRYAKSSTYQPTDRSDTATAPSGSPSAPPDRSTKTGGFGVAALSKPAGGAEQKSAEVTASGGSRGVDTERNAKGGDNPAMVAVSVTAAELAAFKREGGLR